MRLRAAEPGAQIRGLVRAHGGSRVLDQAGVEVVTGSLEDEDALRRGVASSECVIHLAGATHARDAAVYQRVNAEGTARLARIASAHAVRLFVFASTRAIATACGAYAVSKQRAEAAIRACGLRYTILRFAEVYGPDSEEGLGLLLRLVRRSLIVPIVRDVTLAPIHLLDAVEALVQCVQRPAAENKIYTIAGPRSYTLEECARLIAAALGVRRVVVPIPMTLAQLARRMAMVWKWGPVVPDQLDRLWCRKDDDIAAAQQDLGVTPRPFEEGVQCLL